MKMISVGWIVSSAIPLKVRENPRGKLEDTPGIQFGSGNGSQHSMISCSNVTLQESNPMGLRPRKIQRCPQPVDALTVARSIDAKRTPAFGKKTTGLHPELQTQDLHSNRNP